MTLEVAQFVYLLLHNEKIRRVIDTVGKKGVLLLGRFTQGRSEVLERLREELRKRGMSQWSSTSISPRQRISLRRCGCWLACRSSSSPTSPIRSHRRWLHEIKDDGFRILARKQGDQVKIWSRRGADFTYRFPAIAEAARPPCRRGADRWRSGRAAEGRSQRLRRALNQARRR